MSDKYILDDHGEPRAEPDLFTWAKWFEEAFDKRRVASTEIGDVRVSTVFLGLDHSFGDEEPIFWETMVFVTITF